MTKTIRIENADMSPHVVVVEVWQNRNNPTLVNKNTLVNPTAMLSETIWHDKWLVIKEQDINEKRMVGIVDN